jgi:hypothetical protein
MLKVLANRKDIPYQSLLKVFLAEKIAEERKAIDAHNLVRRSNHGRPSF